MIESLLILFTSFMSGALGIINLIGTGFIFQMINLISKLSNGPDILWRIHLGNFIISALFMIFNFKYMIGRIFFLFLSIIALFPTWLIGKMILNQYHIANYKIIFLLILIIIACINLFGTLGEKTSHKSFNNQDGSENLNFDDMFLIALSSFISSLFEINFGVIFVTLILLLKVKVKMKSLANLTFCNMLIYSGLNLIWYLMKREIILYQSKEIYIFSGIAFGALFTLILFKHFNDSFLRKISTSCILIYLITIIFGKLI